MLKSHPELVHLDEVCEHKTDRILKIAPRAARLLVKFSGHCFYIPIAIADRQKVSGLAREIVSKKQTSSGVLYSSGHLEHVLHDFFDGRIWHGHINRPNGNHQVQPWYNIACISILKLVLAQLISISYPALTGPARKDRPDGAFPRYGPHIGSCSGTSDCQIQTCIVHSIVLAITRMFEVRQASKRRP